MNPLTPLIPWIITTGYYGGTQNANAMGIIVAMLAIMAGAAIEYMVEIWKRLRHRFIISSGK